jgi:hypothetical protein
MLCDIDIRGLTPSAIKDLILSVGDAEFIVVFRKRTTGATRTMRAKLGTHRGGQKSMAMERDNLLPVIDLEANGWRAIPLDSVVALKLPG